MFNLKKFDKEIKALKALSSTKDSLTQAELAKVKAKVLTGISSPATLSQKSYSLAQTKESVMRYVVGVLLGLSLVGGTAFASNSSKPGDALYAFKRVKEKVALSLAGSEEAKVTLQAKFAQERLKELKKLEAQSQDLEQAQLEVSGSSATATASSTNIGNMQTGEGKNKTYNRLEAEAKTEAEVEINGALKALSRFRGQLQIKGKGEAAEAVGRNILRLQTDARLHNIIDTNLKDDQRGGHGRVVNPDATSTAPGAGIIVPKKLDPDRPGPVLGDTSQTNVKSQVQPGGPTTPEVKDNLTGDLEIK